MIFDFNENTSLHNWETLDDVVMGGSSQGNISLSPEGHGRFSGQVSLKNNGGFSSVRYNLADLKVEPQDQITIRLKGDGKRYQFRVKHDKQAYASYITYFETTGKWEEISISLRDLYPTFRGKNLDQPNFNHHSIQQLGFLIANKKTQVFELLIDKIELISE
ncbi:CIA30 family protein [Fodinibius sp. SL11]|uniref:CIA30 family protein n=1 Tax=Fodinibius sp. SL11 TaxID=3425690 RepID=UPI003F8812D3